MRLIKARQFCLLLILTASFTVSSQTLVPFEAKYKAFRFGRDLGYAQLALQDLGREKFRLSYTSKVSFFFLSDERNEVSLFSYVDNQIIPYKYKYRRTGTGSDKKLDIEFDQSNKMIHLAKDKLIPWQGELDNQLYRLDLQHKLSLGETQFSYKLINYRGQLRQYDLVVVGKEQLTLPYGLLEGIKVKIVRANSNRETFAWFAPELHYLLVRLQQFKDGDEEGDIQLSEYNDK
jgi:hypothetical protein